MPRAVDSLTTWWLGSRAKRGKRVSERERENLAKAILLFITSLISHTVSFQWLSQLQRPTYIQEEGTLTPTLDGDAHPYHIVSMWSGPYIEMAIQENIICHRGVSRRHGEWKSLGNTLQYYFVIFGLQLMLIMVQIWPKEERMHWQRIKLCVVGF